MSAGSTKTTKTIRAPDLPVGLGEPDTPVRANHPKRYRALIEQLDYVGTRHVEDVGGLESRNISLFGNDTRAPASGIIFQQAANHGSGIVG